MAAAPALELRIERQGAWRVGVGLLVGLACAAILAWWWAQPDPAPGWASAVGVAACAGAMACGAGLVRSQPAWLLRWDRQQWLLARGSAPGQTGELGVAIDFGSWMLLRFAPGGRRGLRRVRWIAVQRRGLEAQWHALRCTVYGPRTREPGPP